MFRCLLLRTRYGWQCQRHNAAAILSPSKQPQSVPTSGCPHARGTRDRVAGSPRDGCDTARAPPVPCASAGHAWLIRSPPGSLYRSGRLKISQRNFSYLKHTHTVHRTAPKGYWACAQHGLPKCCGLLGTCPQASQSCHRLPLEVDVVCCALG